ncbi:MAG: DNA translocase FtsK [Bacteroidales bacterium]|nr:DNA translocase FtsK [Bacteroidales bacterium]
MGTTTRTKAKSRKKAPSAPLFSDSTKRIIRLATASFVAIFAVFTFLAITSYLFTWKADMSLLNDPAMLSQDLKVNNLCGKTGYCWAHFLVSSCFGLGSYAFVFLLALLSARLFSKTMKIQFLRQVILVFSGAYFVAVLLAFIAEIIPFSGAFGGGPGGGCGAASVAFLKNLLGMFVTGLVVLLFLAIWLALSSKRFAAWLLSLGERKPAAEVEPVAEEPLEEEPAAPDYIPSPFAGLDEIIDIQEPAATVASEPAAVAEEASADEAGDGLAVTIERGEGYDVNVTEELERIDIKGEFRDFEYPSLDILKDYANAQHVVPDAEINNNCNKIRSTLLNYRIEIESVSAVVGPTVTLYKVVPAPGVKIATIKNVEQDIAMSLGTKYVRVVILDDSVGIEMANRDRSTVPLKSMLNDPSFRESHADLPIALGYTIQQEVKTFDLASAPHLLVAGATKQGKSVCLNVLIASLLFSKHPSELKFVFIDPKMVEFTAYKRLLKHYLAVIPEDSSEDEMRENCIVKKPKQADLILRSLCIEMDNRYDLLSKAGVNAVKDYNEKYLDRHLLPTEGHHYMPYLVVVIDEFADLTMSGGSGPEAKAVSKSVNTSIIRLAQKGRAAGIHIIIATQRPSVDVVTPLTQTHFPTTIALRVVSKFDSQTILDTPGAEKLIGNGDMLYYAGVEMERVQCAFISSDEINSLTKAIGSQEGYKKSSNPYCLPVPETEDGDGEGGGMVDMTHLDAKFEEAARLVVMTQRGSTSDLQRKLGVGYAKAGRIMDQLEAAGVVGPQEGSKPRQVLVSDYSELDGILSAYLGE